MKTHQIILISTLLALLTFMPNLQAQTPNLLNYQGKLTNKDGMPASGIFVMIFSIYSEAEGGKALWDETQNITVTNGIFNVLLGSIKSFDDTLFAGKGNRYLGVKAKDEPEMAPRFLLTRVPYAFHAVIADGVKDDAITHLKQTITTYKSYDQAFIRHTGTGQTKISEFNFTSVPAGDVYVTLTCFVRLDLNSISYGTVFLEIGADNVVQESPTHHLISDNHIPFTFHGCLQNFSGGQLNIRLIAFGERAETSFTFGSTNSDVRFGRWLTVIAGL